MPVDTLPFELTVGLEVHIQLLTRSKLFCADSTLFGAAPNTQVSPVSLGHPGTLPVLNEKTIELAIALGLALGCRINTLSFFDRKNYFYPDLPKGYQITQQAEPVLSGGCIRIQSTGEEKEIRIHHIHLEEDAGKSIHDADPEYSCIDLNRAGMPLLELVTEPDLTSAEDAYSFLTELRRLVRWLNVCDGNMEEGSLRCDANVSIRPRGEKKLGTRVEIKNLNSIRNVKRAIEFEYKRMVDLATSGEKILQQTRSFDAEKGNTFPLRSKEEAHDYRYFPEPDLPPVRISETLIQSIRSAMPELPHEQEKRFRQQMGLSAYDSALICSDKEDAAFFEEIISHGADSKAGANWLNGPLRAWSQQQNLPVSSIPVTTKNLASLISLVKEERLSFSNASGKILNEMINRPGTGPLEIAQNLNLIQETDSAATEEWVKTVLAALPEKVEEYRKGKKGLLGLFAGEVKKLSKGKANMEQVHYLIRKFLDQ